MSTPGPPIGAYVSIGNSDSALAQYRWAQYHAAVTEMITLAGATIHGEFFSAPTAQWQNACWCIELQPGIADRLKSELAKVAQDYEQDAIGWQEALEMVYLG